MALDDVFTPAVGVDVLIPGWLVSGWGETFRFRYAFGQGGGVIAGGEERELLFAGLLLPELLLLKLLVTELSLAERMVLLADLATGADDAEGSGFQAKSAHVGGKAQHANDCRGHSAAVD